MAFPHQQSRKEKHRNDEELKDGGILLHLRWWTVNVTENRKAKEDVNPAKNRALGALGHGVVMGKVVPISVTFPREQRFQSVEDLFVGSSAQGAHLRSDLGALKLLDPGQVCLVTLRSQSHG